MTPDQLLEDVAWRLYCRKIHPTPEERPSRFPTDPLARAALNDARAALDVAIEACAQVVGNTRLGWTQEMQMVARDAAAAIRSLKPKDYEVEP